MKRLILLAASIFLMLSMQRANAQDFFSVNNDGDTIYYNITSSTPPLTVEVTGLIGYLPFRYTGNIVIPESVTNGENSYSVTAIGRNGFRDNDGLVSVTIPNTITTIGEHAFQDCDGLTSLTIPYSVTSIGDEAFEYCSKLTEVYVKAEVPPSIGGNAFWWGADTITLYVPCGKKTAYQNVTGWSDYVTNIIDNIPFDITAQSNDTAMGIAYITEPNTCANNNTAVIEAIANAGYRFLQWNDGNTENPRTVIVTQNTTFTATFDVETGITDIEASALSLYPNPATDNISIILPENVSQAVFIVYDMQGKILIHQEVNSKETVAVNKLASGIYIYNVRTSKQNYQGKLIHK
jgi:hypothetical protein